MTKRDPLHAICPYFAMFPEDFVAKQVLTYTSPGDTVFDPFSGRGTTVFQSLLMDRRAAGSDINPVAACISGAKADPPSLVTALMRLAELEIAAEKFSATPPSPFFEACYSPKTLSDILLLRNSLDWRNKSTDRFIAAVALGALHGESHRSKMYFSNRMPRTISTKPEYSMRWWSKRELVAPERDVFEILRMAVKRRLSGERASVKGTIALGDARVCHEQHAPLRGAVKLVVTSPPYLDTTDYAEDQWLRLWFLGGEIRPRARLYTDDRHTQAESYWKFLQEVWASLDHLMSNQAILVVRIGGRLSRDIIQEALETSIKAGMKARKIELQGDISTTSIKRRQTNTFRPGTKIGVEHDFVFSMNY